MGTGTPKDTMNLFFGRWSIGIGNGFCRCLVRNGTRQFQSRDGDFKSPRNMHSRAFRGFLACASSASKKINDDEIRLRIDFMPGMMSPRSVTFRRVNEQWKVDMF